MTVGGPITEDEYRTWLGTLKVSKPSTPKGAGAAPPIGCPICGRSLPDHEAVRACMDGHRRQQDAAFQAWSAEQAITRPLDPFDEL